MTLPKFTLAFVAFLFTTSIVIAQCPTTIPLWSQQALEDTLALYPNCEHYPKAINIVDGSLTDLTPLSSLKSVKSLTVRLDTSLTSLHGLHNITTVEDIVWINASPLISDLSPLDGLENVGGDFRIWDMHAVQKIDGFNNLAIVGGDVDLWSLPALTELTGFQALTSIGGSFELSVAPLITDFNAFNSVEHIEEWLTITFNTEPLKTMTGFQSLATVGGTIDIRVSEHLALDALTSVGGDFTIGECNSISLENLTAVGGSFGFYNGTSVFNGCDNLVSVGGAFSLNTSNLTELGGFNKLETAGRIFIVNSEVLDFDQWIQCPYPCRWRLLHRLAPGVAYRSHRIQQS